MSLNSIKQNQDNDDESETLELFGDLYQRPASIRDLSLNYQNNGLDDETLITQVLEKLENFSSLESFSLQLQYNKIKEQGLHGIGEELQKMHNLKELEVNLKNNNIGNSGLDSLLKKIKQKSLDYLELILQNCGLKDEGIPEVFDRFTYKNHSIKNFRLSLHNNYLSDQTIDSITQYICRMTQVHKFMYCVGKNNISKDSGRYIMQSLQNLNKLKDLELYFYNNSIQNTGLINVLKGIANFPHLQELTIHFQKAQIGEGVIIPAQHIKPDFPLHTIDFNFYKNDISDDSIISITTHISQFKQLQRLSLSLFNNKIGDQGFEQISSLLSELPHLLYLQIYIGQNEVTGMGLEQFADNINSLKSLQNFNLWTVPSEIQQISFCYLINKISKHPQIRSLTLEIGLEDKEISNLLVQSVLTLQNIYELNIDLFNFCEESLAYQIIKKLPLLVLAYELDYED
ncbi:hypothetical protein ABPG72_019566 [Tetrahymena utriculariae]